MQKSELLYQVNFICNNSNHYTAPEYKGWVIEAGDGYFEHDWSIGTFWHDAFEHYFENSDLFQTESLSQAGEIVAMGHRKFFVDHSGLVGEFNSDPTFGHDSNIWSVIISQIIESFPDNEDLEGYEPKYPNDFNYQEHEDFDVEYYRDFFEGTCKRWVKEHSHGKEDKFTPELCTKIERAFGYGYFLAEKHWDNVYVSMNMIYRFMNNYKDFLSMINIPDDTYQCHEYSMLDGKKMNLRVYNDKIVLKLDFCDVVITDDMNENQIRHYAKMFHKWGWETHGYDMEYFEIDVDDKIYSSIY